MQQQMYSKGEIIFREGTFESRMYDVRTGTVGIYTSYGTQSERELTRLSEGRYFGEMGMLEAYPRSATAVALEDNTWVTEITADDFGQYLREQPEQVMSIMRGLSGRLRELTGEYRELCSVIAELEQVSTQPVEKKRGFLSRLKDKLTRYADEYDRAAAELNKNHDLVYMNMMMSTLY